MKNSLLVLTLFSCVSLHAQPLSGSFAIGGAAPDFLTLQDAANALMSRGVSGPVFLNIRPGTYMSDSGASAVMVFDSTVAGTSQANRITFQPDAAAGGSVENVILQVDFNTGTQNGERYAVKFGVSYVTFRDLTFRDADNKDVSAAYLIDILPFPNVFTVDGLIVDGCKFFGEHVGPDAAQFSTIYGIASNTQLTSATITNCSFSRFITARGIDDTGPSDTIIAEGNRIDSGNGNTFSGGGIQITCPVASVKRNFATTSSGVEGIRVRFPVTAVIEANYISGAFRAGLRVDPNTASLDRADSVTIANNIVIGGASDFEVDAETRNTKILHNTILSNAVTTGLSVTGAQCTVLNNILLCTQTGTAYNQGSTSPGLVSGHNDLFSTSGVLAFRDGQSFTDLGIYRATTHLDSNSSSTDISFSFDSLGIRLDECQSQEPALFGIPLGEVRTDFYGKSRDSVKPFVGAVEGVRIPYDMYGAVYKSALPGSPFSLAAGVFVAGAAPDIAVPDYSNKQVHLFHNDPQNRSFTQSGTVFTTVRPVVIKFADLDRDGHLDLVVGGDTNAVQIFWGDGTGSFSSPTNVQTIGRVRGIEQGDTYTGFSTMVLTEDNGFLPTASHLCFLLSDIYRNACHAELLSNGILDTIPAIMRNFVRTKLTSNGSMDIAALTLAPLPQQLIVFSGVVPFFVFGGSPCFNSQFLDSADHAYQFATASLTDASSIIAGDFDGDGNNDLITTGITENECIIIKNQGNLTFTADSIPTNFSRGLVALDYENDGDLDFVTANTPLEKFGVTTFLTTVQDILPRRKTASSHSRAASRPALSPMISTRMARWISP